MANRTKINTGLMLACGVATTAINAAAGTLCAVACYKNGSVSVRDGLTLGATATGATAGVLTTVNAVKLLKKQKETAAEKITDGGKPSAASE